MSVVSAVKIINMHFSLGLVKPLPYRLLKKTTAMTGARLCVDMHLLYSYLIINVKIKKHKIYLIQLSDGEKYEAAFVKLLALKFHPLQSNF